MMMRCLQESFTPIERFLSRYPYNLLYMALARADRVIKLAGNPTDQQMQNLMSIDDLIEESDGMVYDYTRTKAVDWTEGVTHGFEWARSASEYLAASILCNEFHDINQKADIYDKKGMEKLKMLRQIGYGNLDGDNPAFYSTVTTSKVVPGASGLIKPMRYRSTNAFGGEYD